MSWSDDKQAARESVNPSTSTLPKELPLISAMVAENSQLNAMLEEQRQLAKSVYEIATEQKRLNEANAQLLAKTVPVIQREVQAIHTALPDELNRQIADIYKASQTRADLSEQDFTEVLSAHLDRAQKDYSQFTATIAEANRVIHDQSQAATERANAQAEQDTQHRRARRTALTVVLLLVAVFTVLGLFSLLATGGAFTAINYVADLIAARWPLGGPLFTITFQWVLPIGVTGGAIIYAAKTRQSNTTW